MADYRLCPDCGGFVIIARINKRTFRALDREDEELADNIWIMETDQYGRDHLKKPLLFRDHECEQGKAVAWREQVERERAIEREVYEEAIATSCPRCGSQPNEPCRSMQVRDRDKEEPVYNRNLHAERFGFSRYQ